MPIIAGAPTAPGTSWEQWMNPRSGPRPAPPQVPSGSIALQPPPELAKPEGASNALMMAVPMIGSLGSVALIAFNSSSNPVRAYIMGGMFLFMALSMVGMNIWRQKSKHTGEVTGNRREYLAYLADLRATVRTAADRQRQYAHWMLPDPWALPVVAEEGTRVWEREVTAPDAYDVRIGRATTRLALTLEPPPPAPVAQIDPVSASAAHRFVTTHQNLRAVPFGVNLRDVARIEVLGQATQVRSLTRAMLCHLATFIDADNLQIAILAGPDALPQWEWAKWLPHTHSLHAHDAVGRTRMIGAAFSDISDYLPPGVGDRPRFQPGAEVFPHLVVVVDGGHLPDDHPIATRDGVAGVTLIDLPAQWDELRDRNTVRLRLFDPVAAAGGADVTPMQVLQRSRQATDALADRMSIAEAEATARRLTPFALEQESDEGPRTAVSAELTDLLGLPDVRDFDPEVAWRPRLARDRLRVPIGLSPQGQPISLDLKESAEQGMGPHGLLIGATGSGKSEVLRTLVLALALTHSSEALNFVLVDFKGGATFAGMADMPHVSAIITNLGEELTLVDRMADALQGEMIRRQELLRSAGNFANVGDYEKARKASGRTDLPPLPALVIVADEFTELLSAKPDFADLFTQIGRLGRSMHIHLLLSTQRLEEGKLRGLDSHLSYRIGLKTFSGADSRAVIGVPDAFELPGGGGHGFLKPDSTTLLQFRAAYVSAPPKARRRATPVRTEATQVRVEAFTAAPVLSATKEVEPVPAIPAGPAGPAEPAEKRVTFDIAVSRMKGHGLPAHQVWLPPLEVPETFDALMPDLSVDGELGLVSRRWREAGVLTFPLGIVDRPLEQRREVLRFSLAGAGGHMAVVGGPRTGKSTALRSVVTGLALTHTPHEVQFFVMDFGGGTFAPLADLAHVAGVASRSQPDVVRRVLAEVTGIVNAREKYFVAHGIDSIETYRQRRAEGRVDDGWGDVVLIVDGWPTLRSEFDDMESEIQALGARGLTFGLHVLASANQWMNFRTQMKDLFGTKLELQLGNPMDSDIDRKVAANIPADRPGRGLIASGHHVLAALPRIDGRPEPDVLAPGVDHLIESVNKAWTKAPGPKLRLLPTDVSPADVLAAAPSGDQLLLGVEEAALTGVGIDPRVEPHVYAFGDSGSGKSTFIASMAAEIQRLYTPEQAQILQVDYRFAHLGAIPDEYLAGYYRTAPNAMAGIKDLAAFLSGRLPGPDVTADQLRARSWWTGKDVFLLVDDYELVATSQGNPLLPLVPLLPQARDIGLHVVLVRSAGGAAKSLYEPVIQSLSDLASPGLILAGSPAEGPLVKNVKPKPGDPGRAQLVTRRGVQVVQLMHTPLADQ
ncbi:type VII secretion protein EccCa [Pseudactinotalea sp. HY158]|uniref:type VII secretion protein EccCa n=1 Tax=Pseudactinotalea sp. HY158 TaxID=2654547 RepID=UPI001E2E3FB1|nr:type VII secretion protein EccCa [Pseudactinotalea sp. HY158]